MIDQRVVEGVVDSLRAASGLLGQVCETLSASGPQNLPQSAHARRVAAARLKACAASIRGAVEMLSELSEEEE